ncbi:NUDIX domain-containing protein [Candidatus Saccharibacteria bacterium]|jgi:8-oxo-dGTP pyrophosphatase MutT (NUDIX family)|nr:NUDIX domain-containing protein [Candidatus Saccharibacteria bacterium]
MVISYGIIPIYRTEAGAKLYLLLQSHDGFWGFPKGHPENNETPEATAIREAYEETGIVLTEPQLGKRVQYEYKQPIRGTKQTKRIILFPAQIKSKNVTLQALEIAHHDWVPFDKAVMLIGLDSIIEPLSRVENSSI